MPGGLEHGLVSCDDVSEPGSQVHPEIQHLWKQVELIQKELELAVKHHRQVGRPFSLAEVFCSNQSPLTHPGIATRPVCIPPWHRAGRSLDS